jgi:hypothetical protein
LAFRLFPEKLADRARRVFKSEPTFALLASRGDVGIAGCFAYFTFDQFVFLIEADRGAISLRLGPASLGIEPLADWNARTQLVEYQDMVGTPEAALRQLLPNNISLILEYVRDQIVAIRRAWERHLHQAT